MSGTGFLPSWAQPPVQPIAAGMTPGPAGLLMPQSAFDLATLAPPPAFQTPREIGAAGHLVLTSRDSLQAALAQDDDPEMGPLADYETALQPMVPPSGVAWQQEVIFDRLAVTDDQMQAQMTAYFNAAQSYDINLQFERIKASDYYRGKELGNEEEGRSKLVLTTVRDTIRATLPSLLRVFLAVENPVEFTAAIADNEQLGELHAELARQATSYAAWSLFTANQGWLILHDALLNCLTRKVGWLRWKWGPRRDTRVEQCDNLLAPQLQALLRQPGILAQRVSKRPMLPSEQRAIAATAEGAAYFQLGGEPVLFSALITRSVARSWPIIESVEPDCVWVVADADTVDTARAVFHVRELPASDLIAAGLPADEVLHAATVAAVAPRSRRELMARDPVSGRSWRIDQPGNDASMRMVRYVEGWWRCDCDGDGIAELVHSHAVGTDPKLIRWDRTDEIPLSAMTPYREPGRIVGLSQADMTMDLQKVQTQVMRAVLDSLSQSIFPRTVVVGNGVNIDDVRQTSIGAIIRVTQQGNVQELEKPFLGDKALLVMQQLDAIREGRTGITRTSQGLTAESLQSTTPVAVDAQTGASQDRLDMIARSCAETGLVPLYKGLLRLMAKHQDRPNVLSVRGRWINVDPRALSQQWDCQVNVGGRGTPQERLAMLSAIASKQETILAPAVAQGSLDTPIVGLPEYRNTLARMCEVAGISDVTSYFKELPPNYQPPPPPPPQPSPDQVLAAVEQQKLAQTALDEQRASETERIKLAIDDDRSRAESAVTAWVAMYTAAAQHPGTPVPPIEDVQTALAPKIPIGPLLAAPTQPPMAQPPMPAPGAPPLGAGPVVSPSAPALGVPIGAGPGANRPRAGLGLPPSGPATSPGRGGPPDPASLLAMRTALLRNRGDVPGALLTNRALMPPGAPGASPMGAPP